MACSIASTSQYQPMTPLQIKQKARDINQQGLEANKSGDTRVALSCFERAHELDPEEPVYLLSAANMNLKIEQAEKTRAVRRKSTTMYLKVLESPELAPRLAEKAQAKLDEAREAQAADTDTTGWPGGVLIGASASDEHLTDADKSEPTEALTGRLQVWCRWLLALSLLFAPMPQGLFGLIAASTVLCCCCCADQGPASNLGVARCAAWAAAVSASACAALCLLGGVALQVGACDVAPVPAGGNASLALGAAAAAAAGESCVPWPAATPWLSPLALALALVAAQLAHGYVALRTAQAASALMPRLRLEILLH
jgi:hypothetical protein